MSDHSPNSSGARNAWPEMVDGGSEAEPRWYAVQCLSHRESMASSHLRNQGFPAFLPRRQKMRRHARKIDVVLAPFFPGYLFVQLDLQRDQWRSVNGTYGVGRLVMQGDAPAAAPRGVIEALRDACDENGVLRLPNDDLKPGQSVRILSGAFADFVGEIDRLDDAGRVRVLLDIMGGGVPVVLPKGSVMPASNSL
ncbi:MAG: transcriptional activator RfaH [Rhizomicrobium sp.]